MRFRKIIKLFDSGNVCVCGLRGTGKDMLMANVAVRRKKPYISNIDYGGNFHRLHFELLDCGQNTFVNFLTGNVHRYVFPYPEGTDVYLSDAGIYTPSQYCSELNRLYGYMATFQAISRHVGDCNFHFNAQNLNRVWDKIREQSDQYIMCRSCHVFLGIVFQRVRIYEKYQSAVDRVPPFRVHVRLSFSSVTRSNIKIQKQLYDCAHGRIVSGLLIYRNKSSYNTRFFKEVLANA